MRCARTLLMGVLALLLAPLGVAGAATVDTVQRKDRAPAWVNDLQARLLAVQGDHHGELGVHVVDLDAGHAVSLRGEEIWYLASGVKIPVAIAVIRRIEEGALTLEQKLVLEPGDYVDGAGPTKRHRPGSSLRVDYLLEQMIIHSDNTATDVLIRAAGLDYVNIVAAGLMAARSGPITTLGDVRRHIYGALHGSAFQLSGNQLLALRETSSGPARLRHLVRLLGIAESDLLLPDLEAAFDAYYAGGLNAATLHDYSAMLIELAEGRALAPAGTGYLIDLMARVETGRRRIRAGLPSDVVFAHKTGTQHRRVCDFGIVMRQGDQAGRRIAISACVRNEASLAKAERALRDVGAAVTASGVLLGDGGPIESAMAPR